MKSQHLSDEAVAAFADGCLSGHARDRAARHTADCVECAQAVRVQREAAWALRGASTPCLPSALAERLRGLPGVTAIGGPPVEIDADGSAVLATSPPRLSPERAFMRTAVLAPAALRPPDPGRPSHPGRFAQRGHPFVSTTAAVVALAGVVAAGSAVADTTRWLGPGRTSAVREVAPAQPDVTPAVFSITLLRQIGR